MHFLLITQYFHPEIGAAASRWGDYVKLLIDKGHKVSNFGTCLVVLMVNFLMAIKINGLKKKFYQII